MGLECVADAGPLIHLSEIHALRALRTFERVHVPEIVWHEAFDPERANTDTLLGQADIQRHTPAEPQLSEFVHTHVLESLHGGEQACLYLCRTLDVPLLLTDDLAAREAAQALAIRPVGSLGVIVRAYREELFTLDEAERLLFALQDVSSLYVTRAIVELAVEQLRSVRTR